MYFFHVQMQGHGNGGYLFSRQALSPGLQGLFPLSQPDPGLAQGNHFGSQAEKPEKQDQRRKDNQVAGNGNHQRFQVNI
jgi:hypothetical protein